MGTCRCCGKTGICVSDVIGFCVDCIRGYPEKTLSEIEKLHAKSRKRFGLPAVSPKDANGLSCGLCNQGCLIPKEGEGYCKVWGNQGGKLKGVTGEGAFVSWYLDPLPTNCVAAFVCPEGVSSCRGGYNLAVFYEACNFNCLYCQNWHYRRNPLKATVPTDRMLEDLVDEVRCVCFFGGDPGPQVIHALSFCEVVLKKKDSLRVCWETNGFEARWALEKMMDLTVATGGVLKVDIKAFSGPVYKALCGVDGGAVFDNFRFLSELALSSSGGPYLVASTLLVPGYIDEKELEGVARFLGSIDPEIPWVLLAFHPDFLLVDLPTTSRLHVSKALGIAEQFGLRNVRVGNLHLLSDAY